MNQPMNKFKLFLEKCLELIPLYRQNQILEVLTDRQCEHLNSNRLLLEKSNNKIADQLTVIQQLRDAVTSLEAKNYNLLKEKDSLQVENDQIKKQNKVLTNDVESLQRELTMDIEKYNLIDFPSVPLKDIDTKIKYFDPVMVDTLVEYLKLDSYELVKNLASRTNSENA